MYNILLLDGAIADIRDAHDWYEERQQGLGKRFQKTVFSKLDLIQQNPLLYQVRFSEVFRFAKTDIFPFLIVFEIVDQSIIVNAVFHTSRNPNAF
ncbi:type II toxin-antitoxin system RelE/ParE family toxin [Mucilaginibacter conchicola]|uniref:Type II toxin-antitoxin system RelE/ParE family toxin n=1 Tax=Mucilaginibacter conchicola TaxID=2303333 RepID=A0A372NZ21_9SPHI|nr:type II toxin-antitoxin system RelE/ParE family toxin [Mucilaginibacter conchicola]RFZ95353.1 type II toxin-antitoxin system RelE/ParE family toxin [Mucilaginibacter conchicola]